MIKRITNIIAVIVLALQASAMTAVSDTALLTARTCLTVAPERVLPHIDKNVRLDMLDYYDAGSSKPSKNVYGGDCVIISIESGQKDTSSLTLQVADSAIVQIFVLNADTSRPIIGIIETLPTPIADSQIKFYDSKWNEVTGIINQTTLDDWIKPEEKKQKATLEQQLPFVLTEWVYEPSDKTLTITQNMDEYFAGSESPSPNSAMRKSLRYQWNGKTFKAVKK